MPDNRSRKRMLQQFGHAAHFGDMFLAMVRGGRLALDVAEPDGCALTDPTVTLPAHAFLRAWAAYMVWRQHQPRGDDLAPAMEPPAEIRVPPSITSEAAGD